MENVPNMHADKLDILVEKLISNQTNGLIDYLKNNPKETKEFCLKLKEYCKKNEESDSEYLSILINRLIENSK